jgi:6-phosphogluconolactonase
MHRKAAAAFLVCTNIATWIGCGSTSSHFVYATIPAANQVQVYREDPNSGVLTALSGSPFAAGSAAQSLVVHPSKKFLYVANSGENDVSLFTISSTGSLTEVTPRPTVGTTPILLAMDTAGSFLFVANAGSPSSISVFSINSSSGALTQVQGSPFLIGLLPLNMKLSPSGGFLYVSGAGSPGVVEAFSLNGGKLSLVAGSPFNAGTNPYGLAIDPSGAHLYAANFSDNSISEFTIGSDGALTAMSGSPLGESFSAPVSLLVDPSGKYLYVANEGSSNIAAYTIGSGGSLTILSNSPFTTGSQPNFMAADPSGKYLLVGNQSGGIQVFSLNSTNGTLTSVATYSAGNTPTSIAVTQ